MSFGLVELINYWGYGAMSVIHIDTKVSSLVFMLFFTGMTVTTCFAFMILFRNYQNQTSGVWESLSANAYGIYLFHYVFITWSQFALLGTEISPVVKFLIVFLVSLSASWGLVNILKKLKLFSSII